MPVLLWEKNVYPENITPYYTGMVSQHKNIVSIFEAPETKMYGALAVQPQ